MALGFVGKSAVTVFLSGLLVLFQYYGSEILCSYSREANDNSTTP